MSAAVGVVMGGFWRSRKNEIIEELRSLVDALKEANATLRAEVTRLQGRLEVIQSEWLRNLAHEVAQVARDNRAPRRRGDDAGDDYR